MTQQNFGKLASLGVISLLGWNLVAPQNAQAIINSGTTFSVGLGLTDSITPASFLNGSTNVTIDGGIATLTTANSDVVDVQAILTPGTNSDVLTVTFTAQDSTADIFPSGFTNPNNGNPLDLASNFVGASLGRTPVSLDGSQGDWQVDWNFLNDGSSISTTSTALNTGPWDGSYGFFFNDTNIISQPIDQLVVTTTVQEASASVPFEFSPTLGLLAVGGLIGFSRLRKSIKSHKLN